MHCSLVLEETTVSLGAFSENLTIVQNNFVLNLVGVQNASSSPSRKGIFT